MNDASDGFEISDAEPGGPDALPSLREQEEDDDWEARAYPNAPVELQRALRAHRALIRAFLASDLGRCEPRRPPRR